MGSISSGGLASFFGADNCSSRLFSLSLSFSRLPGLRSLMSRDKFLHRTSISNLRLSCNEKQVGKTFAGLNTKSTFTCHFTSQLARKPVCLSHKQQPNKLQLHADVESDKESRQTRFNLMLVHMCKCPRGGQFTGIIVITGVTLRHDMDFAIPSIL